MVLDNAKCFLLDYGRENSDVGIYTVYVFSYRYDMQCTCTIVKIVAL